MPSDTVGLPPLHGVRVIELASFMSGPFASMMLADLGAEVIKIEAPSGDLFRRFMRPATAMSPQFASTNRNKSSLVVDLKSTQGSSAVHDLLAGADVLVCNWRPAVAARLGLADATLALANPRLIRGYLTGFGKDGPDADRPAFDPIIQARSGMTAVYGDGRKPGVAPNFLADTMGATMITQAILAALVSRERTGHGDRIDVAMLDSAAYLSYPGAMSHRTFLDHAQADTYNRETRVAHPIAAADGWLVVSAVSASDVRNACAAVDQPEWAAEVLAETDTVTMLADLASRLEGVTRTGTAAHWVEAFVKHDVAAAVCQTADEHLADPQVRHTELYSVTEWSGLGRVRQIRYPARFGSSELPLRPAPGLNEKQADLPSCEAETKEESH